MPLSAAGSSHYYILTDSTDQANAEALGLNHSPKLAFSRGGATTASLDFEKVILVDRVGKVNCDRRSRDNLSIYTEGWIGVARCPIVDR